MSKFNCARTIRQSLPRGRSRTGKQTRTSQDLDIFGEQNFLKKSLHRSFYKVSVCKNSTQYHLKFCYFLFKRLLPSQRISKERLESTVGLVFHPGILNFFLKNSTSKSFSVQLEIIYLMDLWKDLFIQ